MHAVRIYEMPECKMVASQVGMFGESAIDNFNTWMETMPRPLFPKDFLTWDDSDPAHPGFRWYYLYEEGMTLPEGAPVVDFPGGMYAVVTDVDQPEDRSPMDAAVAEFIAAHGLERDDTRRPLGNIITSPAVSAVLGFEQMDYYYPVRPKA